MPKHAKPKVKKSARVPLSHPLYDGTSRQYGQLVRGTKVHPLWGMRMRMVEYTATEPDVDPWQAFAQDIRDGAYYGRTVYSAANTWDGERELPGITVIYDDGIENGFDWGNEKL